MLVTKMNDISCFNLNDRNRIKKRMNPEPSPRLPANFLPDLPDTMLNPTIPPINIPIQVNKTVANKMYNLGLPPMLTAPTPDEDN
jgi:hypothetical protein